MTSVTESVRFTGRVQGINFRRNVFRKALELGVMGWIANQADGSVTGVFHGDGVSVEALINFCLNDIPMARIDSHEVHESAQGNFDTFRIM